MNAKRQAMIHKRLTGHKTYFFTGVAHCAVCEWQVGRKGNELYDESAYEYSHGVAVPINPKERGE